MNPRWTRALLAILLVGQLFLLAGQSRVPGGGPGSLLEGTLLRLLGPLARMVSGAGDTARATSEAARSRGELAEENARLRAEVLDLRRERLRVAALDQEVEALGRGVEYARQEAFALKREDVAWSFSRSRDVEERHAKLYKDALDALLKERDIEYHVCQVCGYIFDRELPETCPVCRTRKANFKKIA